MNNSPVTFVTQIPEVSQDVLRKAVFNRATEMLKMPQVELKVIHYFSEGLYAREMHIPKGVQLVGKIHKFENLNILSQGVMELLTTKGVIRIQAPFTIVSPPGTMRWAQAIEDCVWTTILATDETDPEKIETHFTTTDDQDYLASENHLILEGK